ncbi:CP family cyanate transporter-like MFS transporter [Saccharopolyspora erythraea NRRL 2338]|uniref:Integral membrane transporter n=1 Tax=Saccharopolyspora erythraea (strain ATCC 11635 / DSM 40517 / JCM 4748 / NBRC 13426 / NCIMB 8594 / NRRL 2338) TaxID=405948 RepID=A4FM85_SACEN|nr:major facilitator transporter [Saccharopolyspora erythraea D]PFG98797.1 CP family cyanate transporter-like MFS transporter [Saccharopolyspora erythraea NRRL 2338]QRK88795.1 MFS transporter [Saccharopolyspora erythraea]CAM05160.1 putative integral membrane transporter [Saccharopolyspora erythraea NRRL 2338]
MSIESRSQHVPDHVTDQDASSPPHAPHPDALRLENDGASEAVLPNRQAAVAGGGLLLAGVALAAANMRPAVTSLASVLGEVRDSLGSSSTWASIVTSVPTLCFGAAGIAAPLLARRWGMSRVIGVSLAVLTAAMVLRVVDGPWTVLAGTVLVCASIAMCNVLIPVVVKESFPNRVGMATGLYTTAMAAGGAVGSALTPMLQHSTGSWKLALATWAVVALAAFCVWVPATRRQAASRQVTGTAAQGGRRSLMRSPLAWAITAYFAMQSLVAYVVMGWMPEVFKSAGIDATTSGALLGVLLLVGVPLNMILPPLVTRTRGQSGWAVGLAALTASGVVGLLVAPQSAPLLWALLLGVGLSAFPLALVFISLRTSNAADTGQLSAMSQSFGYLIASVGPFMFGVMHDLTGGWTASLVIVLAIVLVQGCIGIIAGRPRTI